MIGRVLEVTGWLAGAALAGGGLYWGFLNAPESSAPMLALSTLLIVALAGVAAVIGSAAILRVLGQPRRSSLVQGARRAHWFLLAALCGAALGWVVLRADAWVGGHSGEISAWFIATLNWSDVTRLFDIERWLSAWLRWVVIPLAMLSAVAAVLEGGAGHLFSSRWLHRAWGWRSIAAGTLAFLVLIELPWRFAYWRPETGLPVSVEPAVAGARLALIALASILGAAVLLVTAARPASR
ncbi:MAG: hypothetical protein ABL986_06805 [Vicinamibacterales bacterium]